MRAEKAIYGGEMSAHHYFRDFAYCDSGMIPWLLVAELISNSGKSLSSMVAERVVAYPCSGEINFTVSNDKYVMEKVQAHFASLNPKVDISDGIGLEFDTWRMNIRSSNTEPLLRLNFETHGDKKMLRQRTIEIEVLIGTYQNLLACA